MDDNYPTLKRPKKLVYPTTTPCLGQWAHDINTLEDVDKLFDDLDFPSPSPEIHLINKSKHVKRDITPLPAFEELRKRQMVTNGDDKHPSYAPASPEHDILSETPFKAHKPVLTSSPIEENPIQHKNKERGEEDNSASPILFDCEEEKENLETAEKSLEKHRHKNKRDESDNSDFETLPKKSTLENLSAQKKKTVPKRLDPSSPPISPMRRKVLKDTQSAPEKLTEQEQVSTKVKHDMTAFLQKLKNAGQPKPTAARISQAQVMPPLQVPEPDDEFLIMEEDVAFFVSIPNKHSKSAKGRQTKASCSDTEAKGAVGEEHPAQELQDIEQHHKQQESQAEKTNKRTKDNCSGSNAAASNEDCPSLPSTEPENVDDILLQTKKKKKRGKKAPSKDDKISEENDTEVDVDIPSKKNVKGNKTIKKAKSLKGDKEIAQRKKTPGKETSKGVRKGDALTDEVGTASQEVHVENQPDDNAPFSELSNVETVQTENMPDGNLELKKPSSQDMTEEDIVVGKRKRRPPGEWWISSPDIAEQEVPNKPLTVKKTKQPKKGLELSASFEKTATGRGKKNMKQSSSSSDSQRHNAEKETVKKGKVKRKRPVMSALPDSPEEDLGQAIQDRALDKDSDSDSSPLLFPHRDSISLEGRAFDKVYQKRQSEKLAPSLPEPVSTQREGLSGSRETSKRRVKASGNWWEVNPTAEEQQVDSQPTLQKLKELKTTEKNNKQAKKPTVRSPSIPPEGADKQTKRSLTTKRDLRRIMEVSPPVKKVTTSKEQSKKTPAPAEVIEANHNVVTIQMDELPEVGDRAQDTFQESISRVIISGPSSMIGLENYEEEEDIALPSTTAQPSLCASDLCSAPLRPLTLLTKDKVNLQVWLKCLWPTADKNLESTPDDFDWYCHRGRAMGIMTDLQTGTICNGKMLLGSFMKKPLWVDHSATTTFNLFTSSVCVVMDCNKSQYTAGQCFMVPPGHAYSIQNLSAQPAVLYFTRFLTEETDE